MELDRLDALTLDVVCTPSPPGAEGGVAALVRARMERLGHAVGVGELARPIDEHIEPDEPHAGAGGYAALAAALTGRLR